MYLIYRANGRNKTFDDLFLAVFEMAMHEGKKSKGIDIVFYVNYA